MTVFTFTIALVSSENIFNFYYEKRGNKRERDLIFQKKDLQPNPNKTRD